MDQDDRKTAPYARIPLDLFKFLKTGLLNPSDFVVLTYVVNLARMKKGESFKMSLPQIAKFTGISRNTIISSLKKIIEHIEAISRLKHENNSYEYTVNLWMIDNDTSPKIGLVQKLDEYYTKIWTSTSPKFGLMSILLINYLTNTTKAKFPKLSKNFEFKTFKTAAMAADYCALTVASNDSRMMAEDSASDGSDEPCLLSRRDCLLEGIGVSGEYKQSLLRELRRLERSKKYPYTRLELNLILENRNFFSLNFSNKPSLFGLLGGDQYSEMRNLLASLKKTISKREAKEQKEKEKRLKKESEDAQRKIEEEKFYNSDEGKRAREKTKKILHETQSFLEGVV